MEIITTGNKIIYIDIDETICNTPIINGIIDYTKSKPIIENINKANKLFLEGNTIIYWTSRGVISKIDYSQLTYKQFDSWGILYHKIIFNKPFYDIFIDDKAINSKDWK